MGESRLTKYAVRGRAAWITLDSPENRNALTDTLVEELGTHLRAAIEDAGTRAIVVTGTGPAFCAGADLKNRGGSVGAGRHQRNPFVDILMLMWDAPKPVIVAANGHAFGGGNGLVAAADIAIAVDTAKFSFSEVRVGVIPAMISVVVLPKLGVHRTMELFLTGARFSAAQAMDYGLLHRVVPADGLAAAAQAVVDEIAMGGPIAVTEAKRLIRAVARLPMDEAFAYAEQKIATLFASEEAAEGMRAFLEKRAPSWVSGGET
jgi:methylglutaconyl-CoA hydratase